MKVILCTGGKKDLGKIMGKLIGDQLPKIQTETIDSIQGVSRALCRPMNRISVIIIFAVCEKDIQGLFSLAPLFDNLRLILILPRAATGLVSKGLQLNRSFISYMDSDFADVLSVLKKIYHRTRESWSWQTDGEQRRGAELLKFKDD